MFDWFHWLYTILAMVGLYGDPATDFEMTNFRGSTQEEQSETPTRRARRADGLETDIYNGF